MNFINPEKLVGEEFKDKVPKSYIFKLFNIKTGELYVINATMDDLNTIVLALLRNKFTKQVQKTDEEFINDCIEKI